MHVIIHYYYHYINHDKTLSTFTTQLAYIITA